MARENTRDLLLEAGRLAFLERGYNHSGIETILQAARVPKGSFYHYFESKEDFGLKVLDQFAGCYEERLNLALGDLSLSPINRFRRYFEATIERFDSDQCRKGCLVGKLSQELADHSEVFRLKLEEIFRRWEDRYAECLLMARDCGEINPILPIRAVAGFWLNGWQGAMLRGEIFARLGPAPNLPGRDVRTRSPAPTIQPFASFNTLIFAPGRGRLFSSPG